MIHLFEINKKNYHLFSWPRSSNSFWLVLALFVGRKIALQFKLEIASITIPALFLTGCFQNLAFIGLIEVVVYSVLLLHVDCQVAFHWKGGTTLVAIPFHMETSLNKILSITLNIGSLSSFCRTLGIHLCLPLFNNTLISFIGFIQIRHRRAYVEIFYHIFWLLTLYRNLWLLTL